jgi:hypothetical protein
MTRSALTLAVIVLVTACTTTETTPPVITDPDVPPTSTSPDGSTPPGDEESLTCWSTATSGSPGPIQFENVTETVGLVDPLIGLHGHVAAFGDIDDDTMPDLVVGTFGDRETEVYQVRGAEGPAPDRLLIGGSTFTLQPGWSDELGRSSGAVFADFDLDGDDDLLLVRHAGRDGDFPTPTRLYENVDGALTARGEPLPGDFRGRTPAVADFDADGLLDVYVSEDNSGETGGLLMRTEGALEFVDATDGSGLGEVLALSAVAGDLNGDLLPDLATSTAIFINRGGMQFEDATPDDYAAVPIGDEDDPAGVALGDLNRDGLTDVVVGQHYRATVEFDAEVPVRVFINTGGETPEFEDVTESSGLTPLPTLAPHVDLADIDNDGWLDIVTTASAEDGTAPAVYRNMGDDQLAFEVSPGLGSDQYWIGAPVLDIDHDGRLDLFAVEWEPSLPSLMFRNVGDTGHWVEISIGNPGRGIGSVVTLTTADGIVIGRQEIGVGGGYSSGKLPVAHFGLGAETVVDALITFPDGTTLELPGLNADQHLRWPNGCSGS